LSEGAQSHTVEGGAHREGAASRPEISMQLGMIGLGRMGANMARRLIRGGHTCVVYDVDPKAVALLEAEGATASSSPRELVERLASPRALWLMVPAAFVDDTLERFVPLLEAGDVLIDGGNSDYREAPRRAQRLATSKVHWLDVGTSGGVWGQERGYCLMIGGDTGAFARLEPIFAALAPAQDAAPRTPDKSGEPAPGERGYLHCGGSGAGHFVKMVHNGIEYGLMAAYAEGLNLLRHAEHGFDLAAIAELWRRGSVIGSWLLDLAAHALAQDPTLAKFPTQVADSGEGRWTVETAVELGVPVPVLADALFARFASRGEGDFAGRVLSALRFEFGGHREGSGGG
jgi:6-phosphogluconate dehydrogenase